MTKNWFIAVMFFAFTKCLSQYSIAGIPSQYYYDITPDTVLGIINGNISQVYNIDINADSNYDFKITAYRSQSPGSTVGYIKFESLNLISNLSYGTKDSTYNVSNGTWIIRDILKKYNQYDSINSSSYTSIALGYIGYQYSNLSVNATSNQWVNAGEKYVGISFVDSSIVKYGWIKVNVTSSSYCLIEEYSLGAPTIVGIKDDGHSNENILFPSPTDNLLFVKSNVSSITVHNFLGELMPVEILKIENNSYKINTTEMINGVYFIRFIGEQNYFQKPFLIQH